MSKAPGRDEWRAIYEQCAPAAYRRARFLLASDDEAWDVVHDVFLKAVQQGAVLRNEQPMPYFYRAVLHECVSRLRSLTVRQNLVQSVDASEEGRDTNDSVMARNLLSRLTPHLDELDQNIIVLYFVDGLSQEELASVLGVWRRTIGRRLTRIRSLAESLAEPPVGGES